jgi:hypothetical protein
MDEGANVSRSKASAALAHFHNRQLTSGHLAVNRRHAQAGGNNNELDFQQRVRQLQRVERLNVPDTALSSGQRLRCAGLVWYGGKWFHLIHPVAMDGLWRADGLP